MVRGVSERLPLVLEESSMESEEDFDTINLLKLGARICRFGVENWKVFVFSLYPAGEAATAGFLHDLSISIPVQRPPQQTTGYHAVIVGHPNLLHPNHPPHGGAGWDSDP